MKHQCPVCLGVVTWDAKQLAETQRRLVKLHKDSMGRYCPMSGKFFRLVERAVSG